MSKKITTVIEKEAIEKELNWLKCNLEEVHEKMQSLKNGNTELRMFCIEQAVKAAGVCSISAKMVIDDAKQIENYILTGK